MRNYDLKDKIVEFHHVLFATTTPVDYEMSRLLLLEDMPDTDWNEYVFVEGYHCSCYGFDDTQWEATVYTDKELEKLLEAEYPYEGCRKELQQFWKEYNKKS